MYIAYFPITTPTFHKVLMQLQIHNYNILRSLLTSI
jgi:hypothetical protein